MDFLITNWYLFLMAALSGTFLLFPKLMGDNTKSGMELGEAILKMNREKGVLIDVREPDEYVKVYVAQSKNIPLGQLQDKLVTTVKNKALPVLFICANGARTGKAVKIANQLGYENAYSVAGGMRSWVEANMPVITPAQTEKKQA